MAAFHPQTGYVAATATMQQPVLLQPQMLQVGNDANDLRNRKIVCRLAVAEVVLGALCVMFGVLFATLFGTNHVYAGFSIGEGIWCGVWIIVAGSLGIPVGGKSSNQCLVNCHMGFSIVGACFSACLFGLAVTSSIVMAEDELVALPALLCVCSFVSLVLLIVSASYCCYLSRGCCQPYYPGQVVYVTNPNQQPALMMQVPSSQPNYVIQGYQPIPQPMFQSTVIPSQYPTANATGQVVVNPNAQFSGMDPTKQQQDLVVQPGPATGIPLGVPPAYSSS